MQLPTRVITKDGWHVVGEKPISNRDRLINAIKKAKEDLKSWEKMRENDEDRYLLWDGARRSKQRKEHLTTYIQQLNDL